MDYISQIFERLDLQHIRAFLLTGVECDSITDKTYKQRLEMAGEPVIKMLDNSFPDNEETKVKASDVYDYVNTTQDVYMEIGLKCGALLAMRLFMEMNK